MLFRSKFTDYDQRYYNFKLSAVLKTLPDRSNIGNWNQYEYGCQELYRINEDFYKNNSILEIKNLINNLEILNKIKQAERDSVTITHDYRTLVKYLLVHQQADILEFCNYEQFRKISAEMKGHEISTLDYEESHRYYVNDQKFYQLESFRIDVDGTFWDWKKFNDMMYKLYQYLEFTDYQPNLVKQFWQQYIDLHQ